MGSDAMKLIKYDRTIISLFYYFINDIWAKISLISKTGNSLINTSSHF